MCSFKVCEYVLFQGVRVHTVSSCASTYSFKVCEYMQFQRVYPKVVARETQ